MLYRCYNTVMQQSLEKYVSAAKDAGCTADQMRRFLTAGYIALPWTLNFHAAARMADQDDGPYWIALGGARGPGKSHAVLAQVALDDCRRQPGLTVLYLRKLQRSAGESLEGLAKRVLGRVAYSYSGASGLLRVGESRIIIGGYRNSQDIDRYIGLEYDAVVIEEATQVGEDRITALRGSIRSSIQGWRTRVYLSTNPGGIGHRWFKKTFVRADPTTRFLGLPVRFFPATYRDNPFLSRDYIEYLESLRGPLGAAWRDGDWDTFEGIAFPDWNGAEHVVEPFDIPKEWPRWRAIDWGYAAPFVCLWLSRDPDSGRIYVYREYTAKQLTDRQQARIIRELTSPGENINITYADPSMWAKKNVADVVTSIADEYRIEGIILTPADNDRIDGKQRIHRLLAKLPDGKPGLQVMSNCEYLIETMETIPSSLSRPEDVDTEADDHAYDALRYALTNYDHKPTARVGAGVLLYNREFEKLRKILG